MTKTDKNQVVILLVDDHEANLQALTGILDELPCDIMTTTSGNDALALCLKHEFACIFLDVQMPDIDGFELATLIHENKETADVPIVFISAAMQGEAAILKGYEKGAVDYLLKPVDPYIVRSKARVFLKMYEQKEELKKLLKALDKLAYFDPLTNIYNRRQLYILLNKTRAIAHRYGRQFAILLLDIDNFKQVNDGFGHAVGDQLLIQFARRIEQHTRESDFIARMGGDEFAVVMPEVADNEEAGRLAEGLIAALSKPYHIQQHHINASASIGIACYPDASKRSDTLFKNVDIALYKAKSKGKNTFQYFTKRINDEYEKRMKTELALNSAIQKNELYLDYQPRVDMASGNIVGLEALIRWRSAALGQVLPEFFIPIAEENGMIESLGRWIIDEACRQYAEWMQAGRIKHACSLAINVSPYQLQASSFPDAAMRLIQKHQVPIDSIELELTESSFVGRHEQLEASLLKLSRNNIRFAIDDFGTGYSSLSRLSRLPIAILKIDRSFILQIGKNKADEGIIKSVIALAQILELEVIAEGVENQAQADFLQQQGCFQAQGYHYYKPLSADDVTKLLQK
jgi:diguanylate cyclase